MKVQDRYWKMLVQFRFHISFYREHLRFSVMFDRYFKLFIAIFTATSVASWGIWKTYTDVWAVIVALSQLAVIVNESLPYKGRISRLQELLGAMGKLFDQAENKWRDVENANVNNNAECDKINDSITDQLMKWGDAEEKYLKDDFLMEPKWLMDRAKANMLNYFNFFYEGYKYETEKQA